MCEHTPWPQPPAPAERLQTPEPCPGPHTPETHTFCGLEFLGLITPRKPRPAAVTLREAEAAGKTSAVAVEQQLISKSASGDSLSDVPFPDVPLINVALPNVPQPDMRHTERHLDDTVCKE
jgi:hypothetical protein